MFRVTVIGLLAVAVLAPVGLIVYQSFLDGAFFSPASRLSLDAYAYVLTDPVLLSRRCGRRRLSPSEWSPSPCHWAAALAFLLTRTDIKGRPLLEILVLVPMFISSVVLAFGYTVSVGRPGSCRCSCATLLGFVPWNLYSPAWHRRHRRAEPRPERLSLHLGGDAQSAVRP